jgi:hypothetical protein
VSTPKEPEIPRKCYSFEAILEDDATQDELNRLMRKPGDPPYDPTAKWMDPPKSNSANAEGSGVADAPKK